MNGKYASGANANEKVGSTNALYWLQAQIQFSLHPIIIQWKEPSLALLYYLKMWLRPHDLLLYNGNVNHSL